MISLIHGNGRMRWMVKFIGEINERIGDGVDERIGYIVDKRVGSSKFLGEMMKVSHFNV